jgi:uncharacterized membrane protein
VVTLAGLSGVSGVFSVAYYLICPILGAGFAQSFLALYRKEEESKNGLINLAFKPFSDYGRYLGTMLLILLYVFLWTLLLIVPGIIKALSYSMTPFILKDHPELKNNGAIELSMSMMEGKKMKFFLLQLGFIGWAILAIFTLGIVFFWLVPYIQASVAAFYEEAKGEYEVECLGDEVVLS